MTLSSGGILETAPPVIAQGEKLDLAPVIARCASFPIELIDELTSGALAEAANKWLEREEEIGAESQDLAEQLTKLVPLEPDRKMRAQMLALRRSLHRSCEPLPTAALDAVREGELSDRLLKIANDRNTLAAERLVLEEMFTAAETREQQALLNIAADEEFGKALYLASPGTWRALARAGKGNKQFKRLVTSLYGYVMRAVGRGTPNGAWSSVALEGHGHVKWRMLFNVWLEPFAQALEAVGQLRFPRLYSDSWDALAQIIRLLPDTERQVWVATAERLQNLSQRLGQSFDALPPEEIEREMDAARGIVNLLLARYQVAPVGDDQQVLIADRLAAFPLTVSADLRDRVGNAIREYWTFDRSGTGEAHAEQQRRRMFGAVPATGIGLADVEPAEAECEWKELLSEWQGELAPFACQRVHRVESSKVGAPLPPGSALLMLDGAGNLRMGSVTPDPCLFYSRFNGLLRGDGSEDRFGAWYRAGIEKTESCFPDLIFTDVGFESPGNRNAAARLNMTGRLLDAADGSTIAELRLYPSVAGSPKLKSDLAGVAIVPRLHSAAAVDGGHQPTRVLQQLWFLLGRPALLRPLPRFEEETNEWHHLPRLMLGDLVINAERWTPPRSVTEELRAASGLTRYLAWRRYVKAAGIPRFTYVRCGAASTDLLLDAESVVAIEALGRALTNGEGQLLLQETWPAPHDSAFRDTDGRHYVGEMAVAWHGEAAFWESYLEYPQA